MPVAATRHWSLPDIHNLRDLGGYKQSGGSETRWGRILRGEALHHLSPASADELVKRGLKLVIDLRGPHETVLDDHPFRDHPLVEYRNIVLFDALAPISMADASFDMAQRYCDALDMCGRQIAEVLSAIAEAPDGAVLFHCTAGKDRTGIIAALILINAGVSREDIVADYALTSSARDLIGRLREMALGKGADAGQVDRILASDEETMHTMLDHLDRAHGGIANYLPQTGLSPERIRKLTDRLAV